MFEIKEMEFPEEAEVRRSSACRTNEFHGECPADYQGFYWDMEGDAEYCFCDCGCHTPENEFHRN